MIAVMFALALALGAAGEVLSVRWYGPNGTRS